MCTFTHTRRGHKHTTSAVQRLCLSLLYVCVNVFCALLHQYHDSCVSVQIMLNLGSKKGLLLFRWFNNSNVAAVVDWLKIDHHCGRYWVRLPVSAAGHPPVFLMGREVPQCGAWCCGYFLFTPLSPPPNDVSRGLLWVAKICGFLTLKLPLLLSGTAYLFR